MRVAKRMAQWVERGDTAGHGDEGRRVYEETAQRHSQNTRHTPTMATPNQLKRSARQELHRLRIKSSPRNRCSLPLGYLT